MSWIIEALKLDIARQRDKLARQWRLPEVRIITVAGEDAGWLQAAPADGAIFLAQLYLAERFQRRGIGSRIMTVLIEEAEHAGKAVTLGVVKINPARHLYERLGFHLTHEDQHKVYMRLEPKQKAAAAAEPIITVTDAPSPGARAVISDGLDAYSREQAGYWDARPLAVLVTDPESGAILGGLIGRTSMGLLFIDLVYLPPSLRRNGLGSEILRRAEAEARRRGCEGGVLYTISFQAPDFYVRHGWQEFGRIPCDPPGSARVFFRKRLDAADQRGNQRTLVAPRLVPEFDVSNLERSLAFYVDVLEFVVLYDRPEDRFAYLDLGGAHLMLEEAGRRFQTAPLEYPHGRGVNLQIQSADVDTLYARVQQAGFAPLIPLEECWYRRNDSELGDRQFVVADPDGYLLRFFSDLGQRAARQ